jgi:HK97 family phage major capsid protein
MKRKELEERRKQLIADIRTQADAYEARKKKGENPWPDETRKAWDTINTDFDGIEKELKEMDDAEAVSARVQHILDAEGRSTRGGRQMPGLDDQLPGDTRTYGELGLQNRDEAAAYATEQRQRRLAFRAWMIENQCPELVTDEMRSACTALRFNPSSQRISLRTPSESEVRAMAATMKYLTPDQRVAALQGEQRALSKVTATAGPELVPHTFGTQLEWAILTYGGMLAAVTQNFTETGEDTSLPYGDDTGNTGAFVGAEGTDVITQGTPDPAFARQTWGAHELTSKFILVPRQLLEDAFVNLEMEVANMIGERIGRLMNASGTTGNGTNAFKGIVNTPATVGAPLGHTTAAAGAITYDDLVNLQHSIDPAIRPFGSYMFHDNILRALRLLKDTTGRPLWQPSMIVGSPNTINDSPYVINQDMASSIATTQITALFGRLSDYVVRRVRQVQVLKLSERFAEKLQYGYLGYTRADGRLRRPTAAARCTVKHMIQA